MLFYGGGGGGELKLYIHQGFIWIALIVFMFCLNKHDHVMYVHYYWRRLPRSCGPSNLPSRYKTQSVCRTLETWECTPARKTRGATEKYTNAIIHGGATETQRYTFSKASFRLACHLHQMRCVRPIFLVSAAPILLRASGVKIKHWHTHTPTARQSERSFRVVHFIGRFR